LSGVISVVIYQDAAAMLRAAKPELRQTSTAREDIGQEETIGGT
jgi:hypothetical protein